MGNPTEHRAFVNDKPIVFRSIYPASTGDAGKGVQLLSEADLSLDKAVSELEKNKDWKGVYYLCESPENCWKMFTAMFVLIEAAGGLVQNESGDYLAIFRRGKWDLPKGKLDYEETPEQAALREVEEETGIGELKIIRTLPTTFHTYPENKKRVLKKTHWYLMKTEDTKGLKPQAEEDIEEAVWLTEDQLKKKVFPDTYASIRELLSRFFSA